MPSRRLLAPLAERDFRLLWLGQTVSLAGNGMFLVALTWAALQQGSPRALAVVLVAYVGPTSAFLLLGGVVSDRLPRRGTMIASDLVQAAALTAVAVGGAATPLWQLAAAAAVAGTAAGFFLPASTALIPEVVSRERLVAANSLLALSRLTASRLLGPVVGGLLVAAYGAHVALAIDAGTFVFSAATLALLRRRPAPPPGEAAGRLKDELREGLAYCRRRRWLWASLLAFAVLNLAVSAPLAALVPVYVKDHLRLDARALGLLFGAEGGAAALATVAAGNLPAPRRPVPATHVTFAGAGAAVAVMALVTRLPYAVAALCAAGFLLELGNVYWASALQDAVPNRLLGRVSSVDWLVSGSLLPVGVAVVGPAAAAFGVGPVLLAGGALTVVSGVAAATATARPET